MKNDKLKESIKLKIAISEFKNDNITIKNKNYFIKTIVATCACLVLMSGIVFAKDIEKIVRNLFSNSNEAINQAVENGYVQSVENDYVYDKGIGVKVENLVLDELNLNISFKFESQNENIKSIRCNQFIISTDTGEKIYDSNQQYVADIKDVYTAKSVNWMNSPEKINDNTFVDSILFTLGERSNKEKNILYFKIQSFDLVYEDDTREEVYGEWNFDIEITEKMRQSQSIKYKLKAPNEYIENCKATLYPTGLEVEIFLKESINSLEYRMKESQSVLSVGMFYIKEKNNLIEPTYMQVEDNQFYIYKLQYDTISLFSAIQENIDIYVAPYDMTITLVKE